MCKDLRRHFYSFVGRLNPNLIFIVNTVGQPGAIGFIPPLAQKFIPVKLIKLDDDDEPVRDSKTGLAVPTEIGEQGELVGEIIEGNPPREFKG